MPPPADDRRGDVRWQWETLDNLRREQQEGHRRLRQDFSQSQERISADVRELDAKLDLLRDDVRTIQTERRLEERQMLRRHGWIAVLVSGLVTLLIKAVEVMWSRQ